MRTFHQAAAVSQWTLFGLPLDPQILGPRYRRTSNCVSCKNASKLGNTCGARTETLSGSRVIEISAPKTSNTNFGLRFDQVGTQSLGHLGFVVDLGTKIRGFHDFHVQNFNPDRIDRMNAKKRRYKKVPQGFGVNKSRSEGTCLDRT